MSNDIDIGNNEESRIVDAHPEKDFFITILIKDIELPRAIIDLVDNSLDGARRIKGQDGPYDGLTIRLEVTPELFRIADNCGGIDVEIARKYAFRFGRPKDMKKTTRSVGQFGVGMKRAIFKLGKQFKVTSICDNSNFELSVNVDEWRESDKWEYEFSEVQVGTQNDPEALGTVIEVTNLHEIVSKDFSLEKFQAKLLKEIQEAHIESINKGLAITLNGIPLQIDPLEFLKSDSIKPALREITYESVDSEQHVQAKIFAGIGSSSPKAAGWYIFCNGRLILGADQSSTVGWGEDDEITIPRFHNQFARFRGYLFLDSDDSGLLPWNTTKTGIDADSPLYRSLRLEMINIMRPVIDFLNQLDKEKDIPDESDRYLEKAIGKAQKLGLVSVVEDEPPENFITPKHKKIDVLPKEGTIQYRKSKADISKIKKILRVSSNREVGEKTFDYFLNNEGEG